MEPSHLHPTLSFFCCCSLLHLSYSYVYVYLSSGDVRCRGGDAAPVWAGRDGFEVAGRPQEDGPRLRPEIRFSRQQRCDPGRTRLYIYIYTVIRMCVLCLCVPLCSSPPSPGVRSGWARWELFRVLLVAFVGTRAVGRVGRGCFGCELSEGLDLASRPLGVFSWCLPQTRKGPSLSLSCLFIFPL